MAEGIQTISAKDDMYGSIYEMTKFNSEKKEKENKQKTWVLIAKKLNLPVIALATTIIGNFIVLYSYFSYATEVLILSNDIISAVVKKIFDIAIVISERNTTNISSLKNDKQIFDIIKSGTFDIYGGLSSGYNITNILLRVINN